MNSRLKFLTATLSAVLAGGSLSLPVRAFAQEAEQEDVQYLTRGPVHEAFAESVSFDPVAGMIISTAPPEAIEELPPEQQLDGENVTWIGGYWTWDDDENDFIWISGIWRNIPPGRQWVPGYWSDVDGGRYQWTSGYWTDSEQTEVSYVSTAPPRNIDAGPNIEAPSADHSWIPGNWVWVNTRYAWTPGYWAPQRVNWTWVPSRYNWSRRGYVYVDGYWDYAVARRGVLFAPVSFRNRYYARPNYYFTPSIVVGLNVFSDHLFVRPRCGHYYFGDYYAPRYRESGFHASFSWHSGHRGYDPIYAYDRWDHRSDRNWERRRSEDFNYYRDNENARPPRTWAAMRDYREDRFNDGRNRAYASPLSGYAKDNKGGQKFRRLEENDRKKFVSQRQETNKFKQERRSMETKGNVASASGKSSSREKMRNSPVKGRTESKESAPKRPEPKIDRDRLARNEKNQPEDKKDRKQDDREQGKGGKNEANRNEPGDKRDRNDKMEPSERKPAEDKSKQKDSSDRKSPEAKPNQKEPSGRNADGQKSDMKKPDGKENKGVRDEPKREPERKAQDRPKQERKQETQPKQERKQEAQPKQDRKPQAQPKREAPEKQKARSQQREDQSNAKRKAAPERKPQVAQKREAPKPQVKRETPKKQNRVAQRPSTPKPQAKPSAPRREKAAPQRNAPAESNRKSSKEEEKKEGRGN